MNQIKVPLEILDTEIIVNIFKTNLDNLEKDILAQSVVDKFPGVYCFFGESSIYVGESVHPFRRLEQHASSGKLKGNDEIIVFRSEQFNRSAVYDIETKLIDYFGSEQKITLRNQKTQQGNHEYFLKYAYKPVIEKIWDFLKEEGLTQKTIKEIEVSDMFKFSPYKNLNSDQLKVYEEIDDTLKKGDLVIIEGRPGTGKSILASSLYKSLSEHSKVCLTSGTIHTAETYKKIFKKHDKNFSTNSKVLKTSELIKSREQFDVIIIDEAHRLSKQGAKGHPMKYAHIKEDELLMITQMCEKAIIFYDQNQVVHDGDFIFGKNTF